MEFTLVQQININSERQPVIAGTSVSVEKVLGKLAAGMEPNEVMKACQLRDDRLMDIVVDYAETVPLNFDLAQLLKQYRQQQKQKVKQVLQKFKQHCQQQYGQRLVKLVLFGSYARGDFRPSSDIDILVVLKAPFDWNRDSQQVTEFVSDISIQTGELVSCIFMDSDRFQQAQEFLLAAIRQDGILL